MKWHEKIIAAHRTVTDAVSHSRRLQSNRYFVWQEDGSNDLICNDRHAERAVTGTTDLFTTMEFDPWADDIIYDDAGRYCCCRDSACMECDKIPVRTWIVLVLPAAVCAGGADGRVQSYVAADCDRRYPVRTRIHDTIE